MVYFDAYLRRNNEIMTTKKCVLPSDVQKWEWASMILVFRLFFISHTRNVLSSEQLRRYLPPGWKRRPRTQLSWPVYKEWKICRENVDHWFEYLLRWISIDHSSHPTFESFCHVHRIRDKDRIAFVSKRRIRSMRRYFNGVFTSVPPLVTGSEICTPADSGAQAIHSITLSWPRNSPLHSPLGNDQRRTV